MSWKPIDYDGIVNLNQAVVDQLHLYLDNKETQLGKLLLNSIHPHHGSNIPPLVLVSSDINIKLSEAIEGFSKQIRQITQSQNPVEDPGDWERAVDKINKGLWEYLETLEESVTEYFQQLNLVSIEEWRIELIRAVDAIKGMLAHRLDDLFWGLRRIESLLREYRWLCERQQGKWVGVRKIGLFWSSLLDRSLSSNLEKCRKYLGFNYQNFSEKYKRFDEVHGKTEQMLEKFTSYRVFATLEEDSRRKIKKIYQLVKLWELNSKARFIPRQEIVGSLRNLISPDKAFSIFKEYYFVLQEELFYYSRTIKKSPAVVLSQESVEKIEEELLSCRGELHTLGATISKYRDFLLRTDPNPYVRSRLGFPEWIVGQEPAQTKQMWFLGYDIETLDGMYESFRQAIERKALVPDTPISQLDSDIQSILHEMAQPLLSKGAMRLRAERLLNLLQQFDELSNINKDIVDYIGQVLGKALRADWKYHVLFGIQAFHQIYDIHHGLIDSVEDRSHFNRMHKFKRLIHEIRKWLKNNDTPRHTHEIELDMSDIRGYLQDFLGQVQRIVTITDDKETIQQASSVIEKELLEYRYLFGNFFFHLQEDRPEERMIRKQFLFVDQYFEAVENKLHELKLKNGYEREQKEESEEKEEN